MDASEIKDEDSLRAWLEGRPRGDAILIAQRAALRVWPVWGAASLQGKEQKNALPNLQFLLPILIAGAACAFSTLEIRRAAARAARASALAAVGGPYTGARAAAASARSAALASIETDAFARFAAGSTAAVLAANAADAAALSAQASATDNAGLAIASSLAAIVTSSAVAAAMIWREVGEDAVFLASGRDLVHVPLWHNDPPEHLHDLEKIALDNLAKETGTPNSFWHRWYLGAKRGEWLDWELQKAVALLPDEVWKKSPYEAEQEIAKIEAEFAFRADPFRRDLADLPPAPQSQVQAVQAAMERNRQALPPTFDAIEGLLLLEIERLQRSNDRDEAWERQMRIYLTLYEAVCRLRATLPATGPVSTEQAEQSERLLRLYARNFAELPRAKVDEVVDGTWETGKGVVKAGLIGTTALLGMAYGLPALAGVAIGSMIFAPKAAGEIIKSAREALSKPPP